MFTEKEHPLCKRPGRALAALTLAVLCLTAPRPAAADVVTDWNAIALTTAVARPLLSPLALSIRNQCGGVPDSGYWRILLACF